jgi:hypothetical protein
MQDNRKINFNPSVAFNVGLNDSSSINVSRTFDKSDPQIEQMWTQFYDQLNHDAAVQEYVVIDSVIVINMNVQKWI